VTIKDSEFAEKAQELRHVINEKRFVEFCDQKISVLSETPEKDADVGVWEYLKILFSADPRASLLNKLGFDPEKMSTEVSEFLAGLEERKGRLEGKKRGRKRGRGEEGRKGGREEGGKGGREEGRKGGREEGGRR
jgi:hypothetical protein